MHAHALFPGFCRTHPPKNDGLTAPPNRTLTLNSTGTTFGTQEPARTQERRMRRYFTHPAETLNLEKNQ